MKRLFGAVILMLAVAGVEAKGRRPGQEGAGFDWDDSRVQRGSAANPNPAYRPPPFTPSYLETPQHEEADVEKEKPATQKPKKSAAKRNEPAVQESWTFEGGALQSQAVAGSTPSVKTPSVSTAPAFYDPPLPEDLTNPNASPEPSR